MKIEEIVKKFESNPVYLSNGAGFLSKKFKCNKGDIYEAKRIYKESLKIQTDTLIPEEPINKGKLKSRWQNSGGKWLESYSFESEEDLFDIKEVLDKLDFNYIKPIELPKVSTNKKILNIYLSDQHIGASVTNGLYTNYFDADVYEARMSEVIIWINQKAQEFGGFYKINIHYLGDTFDGQDGYTVKRTHSLPQNMSNNEAFEVGMKINMLFVDNLVSIKATSRISIYCVSDSNHGGSMDYYLFKSLQEVIKYKYPEIKFTIANNFIDYYTEGIYTFLYTHGKDGKDMKFGLPLDLNDKTENFINQYLDNYKINSECIRFIKGDLHQNSISEGKRFTYRNVPSLFGSSSWIMKNYGNTKPGVGYEIFNPEEDDLFAGVIKLKN